MTDKGKLSPEDFKIPFAKRKLLDPRPQLQSLIEQRFRSYLNYIDRDDAKESVKERLETELDQWEEVQKAFNSLPNWEVLVMVCEAIRGCLGVDDCDGAMLRIAFTEEVRPERMYLCDLKLQA